MYTRTSPMGPLDRIARRLVGRARAEALGLKDEAVARVSGCIDARPRLWLH